MLSRFVFVKSYLMFDFVGFHISCLFVFFFFFFQAEDGIRDLVRSRGLGDVYKRQVDGTSESCPHPDHAASGLEDLHDTVLPEMDIGCPVSYTHLTLPTIYSV